MHRKYKFNTRIGHLTIIGFNHNNSKKFICRCECMSICEVSKLQIWRGKSSCGCMEENNEVKICDKATKEERRLSFSVLGKKGINIVGMTIGEHGYVIGYKGSQQWWIKCDCGKIFTATYRSIVQRDGHNQIVGCRDCAYRVSGELNSLDLEGKRFGKLIAVTKTGHRSGKGSVIWECQCDCGNIVDVRSSSLTHGEIRSCGCLLKETTRQKAITYCGKNHHLYRHDISEEDREYDRIIRARTARIKDLALERDDYECVICRSCVDLRGHHKDGFNWCKDRRLDLDNIVTLCGQHHTLFHKKYKYGNNTEEQFREFLESLQC